MYVVNNHNTYIFYSVKKNAHLDLLFEIIYNDSISIILRRMWHLRFHVNIIYGGGVNPSGFKKV